MSTRAPDTRAPDRWPPWLRVSPPPGYGPRGGQELGLRSQESRTRCLRGPRVDDAVVVRDVARSARPRAIVSEDETRVLGARGDRDQLGLPAQEVPERS